MALQGKANCMGAYEHNPRGNIWMNDHSTLGHKLLAKMGWKKGKGLGKLEDGITECVRIKRKSTHSGLGWKEKPTFDSFDYESLLGSLSQKVAPGGDKTRVSLVTRHQMLGNRYGYHKVLKQKDITRYSDIDMKSIFMANSAQEKKVIEEKNLRGSSSFSVEPSINFKKSEGSLENPDAATLLSTENIGTDTCKKTSLSTVDSLHRNAADVAESRFKRTKSKACISEPAVKKRKKSSNSSEREVNTCFEKSALPRKKKDFLVKKSAIINPVCQQVNGSLRPEPEKQKQSCPKKDLSVDSWVSSQKQALKMELYKNMLSCLQTHEILQTSNLSSIKGYGNSKKVKVKSKHKFY